MFPLHPAIVHFPIALLMTSVLLDLLGVVLHRASLTQAGFYTLIAGSLGAALSALSGPEEAVSNASLLPLLHRHELFAALTIFACLVMVGIRLRNLNGLYGRGSLGYLVLGALMVGTIALTGYYGGQLAYDHGVGVSQLQQASAAHVSSDAPQEALSKLGGMLLIAGLGLWMVLKRQFLLDYFVKRDDAAAAATRNGVMPWSMGMTRQPAEVRVQPPTRRAASSRRS